MHDDAMLIRIRRTYRRKLTTLRRRGAGDAGTTGAITAGGGWNAAPQLTVRSILDPDIAITLVVTNILIGPSSDLAGHYPPRSRLIVSSVGTRWSRNGIPTPHNLTETDSWGTVLAPPGYEEFVLRLGRVTTSPSYARHYRHIIGPDRHICAIDPYDAAAMRRSQPYDPS